MEEIMKLIEAKPCYEEYYLIEERGKKEYFEGYKVGFIAKNATLGYLIIYDKEAYMFTFKTIYKNSKGYFIKLKGKIVYLEDFKEKEKNEKIISNNKIKKIEN